MPSTAGIYELANRPNVGLLDPFQLEAQKLAIQNSLAGGVLANQQIEQGRMSIAATKLAQSQDEQFRQLFLNGGGAPAGAAPAAPGAAAAAPAPEMDPITLQPLPNPPPPPGVAPAGMAPAMGAASPQNAPNAAHDISDDQILGIYGTRGYGFIHARNEANKLALERRKTLGEVAVQDQNYWGSLAAGWKASGYDPQAVPALLSQAAAHGYSDTPQFKQFLETAKSNPASLPQLAEQALAQSPEQVKLINERMTASANAHNAEAGANEKLMANAGGLLGSTRDKATYAAAWSRLKPEIRKEFTAPDDWTPQSAADARQRGQTANQQATTAETARHNLRDESLSGARVGIERERLAVDKAAADPWGTLGLNGRPMGGGATANVHGEDFLKTLPPQFANTVRAVAEGRQTNLPRGGKELDLLMGAVNQFDPTYSVQRAQQRTAFTTGAQGKNIGNLNTAVVHLDQYHEVMKAMNNGSFQPGNRLWNWAAEKFGSAAVTNPDFVRASLAGEAANALKGNATDPEIANLLKTLGKNQSPAQQEGTALEGLRILGTKLNTYDEQYHQLSQDDPWSPVLPSARDVFARYKIQPLSRMTQSAARTSSGGTPASASSAPPQNLQHMSTDDLLKALVK